MTRGFRCYTDLSPAAAFATAAELFRQRGQTVVEREQTPDTDQSAKVLQVPGCVVTASDVLHALLEVHVVPAVQRPIRSFRSTGIELLMSIPGATVFDHDEAADWAGRLVEDAFCALTSALGSVRTLSQIPNPSGEAELGA